MMLGERLVDQYLARVSAVHDRTSAILDRLTGSRTVEHRKSIADATTTGEMAHGRRRPP